MIDLFEVDIECIVMFRWIEAHLNCNKLEESCIPRASFILNELCQRYSVDELCGRLEPKSKEQISAETTTCSAASRDTWIAIVPQSQDNSVWTDFGDNYRREKNLG